MIRERYIIAVVDEGVVVTGEVAFDDGYLSWVMVSSSGFGLKVSSDGRLELRVARVIGEGEDLSDPGPLIDSLLDNLETAVMIADWCDITYEKEA